MTNILAICSALNNSYLALNVDNNIYSNIIKSDSNYHSLYLINEIKSMCKINDFSLNNLNYITVNTGPGSFTGIRVAITISKVLSQELNIKIIPLNTAEILLKAFNCSYLLMDARRDMFYFAHNDNIKLIYKDKLPDVSGKVLTDKRCSDIINDSICFEDNDIDLGKVMITLAFEKLKRNQTFDCANVSANYIQTPPIF